MNRRSLLSLAFSASICFGGLALAADMGGMDMSEAPAPTTQPSAAVQATDVRNTVCPVSGEEVDGSDIVEIYKGKVYHLCCSDCPSEFEKNPQKYANEIAANPAKYGVKK